MHVAAAIGYSLDAGHALLPGVLPVVLQGFETVDVADSQLDISFFLLCFYETTRGMIRATHGMMKGEDVGIGPVAGGMANALMPIFLGLFVAIPALMLYQHLCRGADRYMVELEGYLLDLVNRLERGKQKQMGGPAGG